MDVELDRIHQIAAYCRDLDEAIAFYRDILGATFLKKFEPPGLAFFDCSGVRIMLEKAGPKATLYFWVDDIDAAMRELRDKGVVFTHKPALVHRDDDGVFGPPGQEEWMALFCDPSDNVLALVTRKPCTDPSAPPADQG